MLLELCSFLISFASFLKACLGGYCSFGYAPAELEEKLRLQSIVAGKTLAFTNAYGISGTEDGVKFRGFKNDVVINIMKNQKPIWLENV